MKFEIRHRYSSGSVLFALSTYPSPAEGGVMKFVISYQTTVQVTEDHWARRKRTLLADENTTLRTVFEWYRKQDAVKEDRLYEPLTITEAEEAPCTS